MDGRVWNGNTQQGVMGILVTAGGQQTLTAHDGTFTFKTCRWARSGPPCWRGWRAEPAQQTANIAAGQTTPIDLVSADPNAVHLTFLVQAAGRH